jgi:hypothetical protein
MEVEVIGEDDGTGSSAHHRHSGRVSTLNVATTAEPNIMPRCPQSPPLLELPENGIPMIKSRVNSKKTNAEMTSEIMHNSFDIINLIGVSCLVEILGR